MKYFTTEQFSDNLQTTPEGYLLCLGVPIARTGELIYKARELGIDSDEQISVTRTEEELFSAATIASFQGKPITLGHPSELLDIENSDNFRVGHLQNVRRGEGANADKLIADLLLTDLNAIQLVVDSGVREVSCGYLEAKVTFEGAEMNALVGNHVAIVPRGRAGPECAIMDSKPDEEKLMPTVKTKQTLADKIVAIFKKSVDEAMEKEEIAEEIMDADPAMGPIEKRLAALESAISALTEKLSSMMDAAAKKMDEEVETVEEQMVGDEEEVVIEDECGSFKADHETISRIEVLAPGFKTDGFKTEKDLKIAVLNQAKLPVTGQSILEVLDYATLDSSADEGAVNSLFSAAHALTRQTRVNSFVRRADSAAPAKDSLPRTPEELNRVNAEYWKGREG